MAVTDAERQDPITVVLERDVPVRLDWGGARYYVDGPAVPLGGFAVTAPAEKPDPRTVTGWRVAATTPGGDSHVFEVISPGGARWCATRVEP